MSAINFNGWVIKDSEDVLLEVKACIPLPNACDSCSGTAIYDIRTPSGGHAHSCQPCLDSSYEDPTSPDVWFAPVPKGTELTTYSDGGQQLTLNLI